MLLALYRTLSRGYRGSGNWSRIAVTSASLAFVRLSSLQASYVWECARKYGYASIPGLRGDPPMSTDQVPSTIRVLLTVDIKLRGKSSDADSFHTAYDTLAYKNTVLLDSIPLGHSIESAEAQPGAKPTPIMWRKGAKDL